MFERSPVRVVLDAQLRAAAVDLGGGDGARDADLGVHLAQAVGASPRKSCSRRAARCSASATRDGKLDLDEVLKVLAGEGITRLMVEGGPTVAGSFRRRRSGGRSGAAARREDDRRRRHRCRSKAWRSTALTGQACTRAAARRSGPIRSKPSSGPDMFTGIVTDMGEVRSVKPRADNLHRITIACDYPRAELIEGASIACSGVCLTVVERRRGGRPHLVRGRCRGRDLGASPRSAAGGTARASISNAPLKFGDELGGHLVAGHVDGLASVDRARGHDRHGARLRLRAPATLARFIAPKGSVTLDGVSLTVNAVEGDTFSVLIIPHTLAVTTFGALAPGRRRQSRNRHHGALRGAADGRELARTSPAHCRASGPSYAQPHAALARLRGRGLLPRRSDKDIRGHGQEDKRAAKKREPLHMLIVEARFYERHFRRAARAAPRARSTRPARATTASRCPARWKFRRPSPWRSMPRKRKTRAL